MTVPDTRPPRILAVASGGGHWKQLLRLVPLFDEADTCYVTVDPGQRTAVPNARFRTVTDASRWTKLRLLRVAWQALAIVVRERPDVVVTTGAAPGLLAIAWGKLLGARTIWIDSMANVARVSLSGRLARPFADLRLTQWPHLAAEPHLRYFGSVL